MTNMVSIPPSQPSPFANVRVQAYAIWRGPKDITIQDLDGETFYGWSTLSLEVTTGQTDRIESRSVYANLFKASQHFAILRAVSWDGRLTKKAVIEQGQNFRLTMPARLVKLPVGRVQSWLSEFNEINVAIIEVPSDDETINIRRLRIEQNYKTYVMEKIWQTQDENHDLLNQKWDRVWMQMTQALATEPTVANFDEDFWFVSPEIVYDFQNYQPDWFTLK